MKFRFFSACGCGNRILAATVRRKPLTDGGSTCYVSSGTNHVHRNISINPKCRPKLSNQPTKCLSSIIYASHYETGNVAVVEVDLDLRSRFKDIKTLDRNVTLRKLKDINVYQLASKHKTLRDVKLKKDQLEAERDEVSSAIGQLVRKEQTEAKRMKQEKLKSRGKEIREDLKLVNHYYYELEEEMTLLGLNLPSSLHPSSPEGDDRVEKVGGPQTDTIARTPSHIVIGKDKGWLFERNVGPRQFYLGHDLACFEQDLVYRVQQRLSGQGYTQVACPSIVKALPVEASAQDIDHPRLVYLLQDNPGDHGAWNRTKYLAGVSPLGFAAYITRMYMKESSLPHKYFATGRNYNPDRSDPDRGLFSCPEATVVEMFGVAKDEVQADSLYEEFQNLVWQLYKQISADIPVRLVSKAPPSLMMPEAARMEVEMWSPWLQDYITVGSISMWSDFLGRRLMARSTSNPNKPVNSQPVHTVHATTMNVTSLVGILVERNHNNGQETFLKIPQQLLLPS